MLDQRIEVYLGNSNIGLDYEVYTCFYSTVHKLLKAEEYAYFKKLEVNEKQRKEIFEFLGLT